MLGNKSFEELLEQTQLWYDITTDRRGDVIWCKAHQYRHIAWLNAHKLIVNCRMYDIFVPHDVNAVLLCACLNSTIVALTKTFFGRYVGREANLDTEVLDTKMMLIPDPRHASASVQRRLESTFNSLRARIVPGNMFQPDGVQIGTTIIELGDPTRCEFVKELSSIGVNGSVPSSGSV